jgi:hypothetical protein
MGESAMSKWIQKAKIKKGALHKDLGIPPGQKIPLKDLKIHGTDSALMKKQKILAKTFRGLNKGG